MMKTIAVIKDGRPYWPEIESYLKDVNADIVSLDLKSLLEGVSGKKPDIVIAGERFFKEITAMAQGFPKMIITERDITESKYKDIYLLHWPAHKEAFLEITSRLLFVSERRIFRTVITILHKRKKQTYLGKSLNFSMSGMAFKVDKPVQTGDILNISFFIPSSEERLSIDAEVTRNSTDPDDGSVYYGARFFNMEKDIRDTLEAFIKKIK